MQSFVDGPALVLDLVEEAVAAAYPTSEKERYDRCIRGRTGIAGDTIVVTALGKLDIPYLVRAVIERPVPRPRPRPRPAFP